MFSKRDSNNKFKKATVRKIWKKYPKDPEFPDGQTKRDRYGKLIKFEDHGKRSKGTGWEIDHKQPKSKGGSDNYSNLEPMHWANNKRKSNKYSTK